MFKSLSDERFEAKVIELTAIVKKKRLAYVAQYRRTNHHMKEHQYVHQILLPQAIAIHNPDAQLYADCIAILNKRPTNDSPAIRIAKQELKDLPTYILKYAKREENHLALQAIVELLGKGNKTLTRRLNKAGLSHLHTPLTDTQLIALRDTIGA